MRDFYKRIQPGGPGWKRVADQAEMDNVKIVSNSDQSWSVPSGIKAMLLGCIMIYSIMFATGYWIYSEFTYAIPTTFVAIFSGYFLCKAWMKIKGSVL